MSITAPSAIELRAAMAADQTWTARYRVLSPSWIGRYARMFGWSVVDTQERGDGYYVLSGSLNDAVRGARDLNRQAAA